MKQQEILEMYEIFKVNYDDQAADEAWITHCKEFNEYWRNKVMNDEIKLLEEAELDAILRILDRNAKGNRKGAFAVAKAMISQGTWRRMFQEIKRNKNIREVLNNIFFEIDDSKKMLLIDSLYKFNEGKKNGLTGKSANAINCMFGALDFKKYLHVISLNDRRRIIEYFKLPNGPDFDNDGPGKRIVLSNKAILEGFQSIGLKANPLTISRFLYELPIRPYWKPDTTDGRENPPEPPPEDYVDISLFYMESQLEDFLIENWDKTELGKEYELIEEDGELVSQQYPTDIGKIDILAKDKKTKQLVVIELKKNQTSDDTVGQLTRYMGWLEEKKTNGNPTKGIIIAARYDTRLYYALKKVKDVEVYLYRVNFKLEEFKKPN